jgi:UDP-N-acetylmuramoyl-tripeptide--D-alanyl-D-alanine ligase
MKSYNLDEVAKAVDGKILSKHEGIAHGVGTDSRKSLKGQLFIALKGDAFDAHQFLNQAVQAGATALIVQEVPSSQKSVLDKVTVIQVKDTLKALQSMGNWVRKQMKAKVLALTGSNGKTSTKEFTAQILSGYKVICYSQGSFNNHWGVPFSLLNLDTVHETAIIEMGMNHPGEITELVKIAEPDAVVCTMVGRAHIEFFGTQEKIAAAKEEIYTASNPKSIAIFNIDAPLTKKMYDNMMKKQPNRPKMTFSESVKADVQLQLTEATFDGLKVKGFIKGMSGETFIPVFGKHNITNLLAAASLALAAGLTPEQVWKGLKNCKSHWGRNQKVKLKSGAVALFDAYNANPDSMEALLENIESLKVKGRKIGVFGQMRELGDQSQHFHHLIGLKASNVNFTKIFFYGDDYENFQKGVKESGFKGEVHVQKDFSDEFAQKLKKSIQADDLVVFKASRGPKLERMLLACDPIDFSLDKD